MPAAISQQSRLSELFAVDAMEPATKRARVEVKPFQQLDLDKFSLKVNLSKKDGKTYYNSLIDGASFLFNLTPEPTSWLDTPFGFDTSGKYEQPSFLGGNEPDVEGKTEGLSLRLNLQPEQAEFLSKLDGSAQKAFADVATATWAPLVSEDSFHNSPVCKVMVALKGANLTKLTIVHNGEVTCGAGWDFLKKFLVGCNDFRRAEVKLSVKVQKVYNVAKKAGMKLEATQMVLRINKPVEEDVFADHAALLA